MLLPYQTWLNVFLSPSVAGVFAIAVVGLVIVLRRRARPRRGLDELADWLSVSRQELERFSPQYRYLAIPKKSGGQRQLDVPDAATKSMQRLVLHRVLRGLRAHSAACGFERGKSVVDNARPHVGRAVVVRMDVEDFFGSTQSQRIEAYFLRVGWDRDAASELTRICCHKGVLPQGAPTSPRLSNLVNFGFDVCMTRFANRRGARYTRYADDITLSFERDSSRRIRGAIQYTGRLLKAQGYTLHLRRKLHIRRRHQWQIVTGLIVNEKLQLPRETRRLLRAVKHRLATGRRLDMTRDQILGLVAWSEMVRTQSQSCDRGRTPKKRLRPTKSRH